MKNKNLFALALVAVMAVAAPAFAEDGKGRDDREMKLGIKMHMMGEIKDGLRLEGKPTIVGKVVAVSGNTISVASQAPKGAATTTFSVDASGAVVFKGNATSTVGNIAVGDTVLVQGTVSGTSVVATRIFDGPFMQKMGEKIDKKASSTPPFQGNGQPIVAGTVTAVSGNTITITNASNVTFTIDATNAKIVVKGSANATISSIAVGDRVVVQGAVNGSAVVASSVLSNGKEDIKKDNGKGNNGNYYGFFRGVGNFFKRIFGF